MLINKINKRITKQLKLYFGTNYNTFIWALEISNGIISGSFIVHAIHKEYKLANDIDIYFKYKDQYITFCNYFPVGIFEKIFSNRTKDVNNKNNSYNVLLHIKEIYQSTVNGTKIQCIILDYVDIKQYIFNNYDFDIVKNVIWFNDGNLNFELHSVSDVITKLTKINKLHYSVDVNQHHKF